MDLLLTLLLYLLLCCFSVISIWVHKNYHPTLMNRQQTNNIILKSKLPHNLIFIQRHHADISVSYSPPHKIPYGDIAVVLKDLGVKRVVSITSVGSLNPKLPVGSVLLPDDYFCSYKLTPVFEHSLQSHFVPSLQTPLRSDLVTRRIYKKDFPCIIDGGIYVNALGPRFETKSEIRWMQSLLTCTDSDGNGVVGMTAAHEMSALQEVGGIDYALISIVDNMCHGIVSQHNSSSSNGCQQEPTTKEDDNEPLTLDSFHEGVAKNLPILEYLLPAVIDVMCHNTQKGQTRTRSTESVGVWTDKEQKKLPTG
eukprot:GHVQ01001777.1.p1 GENE.GHVQ01001777.1~~GHVQ01001777.1.p1  ORF type:complete len:309 (+),score=41.34 GHVQ01001777.1:818-1744(+)